MNAIVIMLACLQPSADVASEAALEKEIERLAIPDALTPKGKQPLLMVRAEGVQIYEATAKLEWNLQAPDAVLRDYRTGEQVGTLSKEDKGPIWVDSKGSKLTGKAIGNALAPNPDAIPWLLVEVKNENGGRYAKATHIQRVDTWAGQKPVAAPTKAGEIAKVHYQATYIFWGDR